MAEKTGRERTSRYRDARRQAGYREATVWLDPELSGIIDHQIEEGRFRSMSDAIAAATARFFKEKTA